MKERGPRWARSRTHGSCTSALVSLDRTDRPATSPHRPARPGARPHPRHRRQRILQVLRNRRAAVGAGRYEDEGRIWSTAAANRPRVGECEAVPQAGQVGPQLGQAAHRAPVCLDVRRQRRRRQNASAPRECPGPPRPRTQTRCRLPQGTSDRVGSDGSRVRWSRLNHGVPRVSTRPRADLGEGSGEGRKAGLYPHP
jgi:hypothetical protein